MVRIMVAEDSSAIRMVLHDILQIGNHELVAEAEDGASAVEKFSEIRPDILLLDLAMPKKDGLTVIKEIMPKFPNAKIIVVSASGSEKLIDDCFDAGAVAYISKPFLPEKVLKTISDVSKK